MSILREEDFEINRGVTSRAPGPGRAYETTILELDIPGIGEAYKELMEWSGTYGKQIRGNLSPAFKDQLKYFTSDSPQEEDSDSTQHVLCFRIFLPN